MLVGPWAELSIQGWAPLTQGHYLSVRVNTAWNFFFWFSSFHYFGLKGCPTHKFQNFGGKGWPTLLRTGTRVRYMAEESTRVTCLWGKAHCQNFVDAVNPIQPWGHRVWKFPTSTPESTGFQFWTFQAACLSLWYGTHRGPMRGSTLNRLALAPIRGSNKDYPIRELQHLMEHRKRQREYVQWDSVDRNFILH
jgi:hypothetical protein